jgi:hypothetical protein
MTLLVAARYFLESLAKQFKQWAPTSDKSGSRDWCGPGFSRETKLAPARGFIGQWSAPAYLEAPAAMPPVLSAERKRRRNKNKWQLKTH